MTFLGSLPNNTSRLLLDPAKSKKQKTKVSHCHSHTNIHKYSPLFYSLPRCGNPTRKNATQIGEPDSANLLRRRHRLILIRINGSDLPHNPNPPIQLPPSTSSPPEASITHTSLRQRRLRTRPLNLLHGRIWNRIRHHRRASRHWIHTGSLHRIRTTRRFHAGTR